MNRIYLQGKPVVVARRAGGIGLAMAGRLVLSAARGRIWDLDMLRITRPWLLFRKSGTAPAPIPQALSRS